MENKQAKKVSKRQALREERSRKATQQRIIIIGAVLLFVAVIVALLVTSSGITGNVGEFTRITPGTWKNADGVKIGDPNAKVVVDVFEDFKCPACKDYTAAYEPQVIAQLVDTGQVLYVFHNFPFLDDQAAIKESDIAANASMCAAEQNLLWDFKSLVYTNMQHTTGEFSKARMEAFAESLDLDMTKFKACLKENRYQKQIDADLALGDQLGVSGTPSVFVNGKIIKPGFVPSFDDIKAAVDAALNE